VPLPWPRASIKAGGIDAELLGQVQAFEIGDHQDQSNMLFDALGDLSGADVADMEAPAC